MKYTVLCALIAASVMGDESTPGWDSLKFAGKYSDPNHPHCPRYISPKNDQVLSISGDDPAEGKSECDGSTDEAWGPLIGHCHDDVITCNFTPKGGPIDLAGNYVT